MMKNKTSLEQRISCAPPWRNLAPNIIRQRLMMEAITESIVEPPQIKEYLIKLAEISKMEIIGGPYTRSAHECGYAGWVHWKTSGCHLYTYPANAWGGVNEPLLTIDTYTCKPFSVAEVVEFTREYFQIRLEEMVWREVMV